MSPAVTFTITAACAAVMVAAGILLAFRRITFMTACQIFVPATGIGMLVSLDYFPHPSSLWWTGACTTSVVALAYEWVYQRRCLDTDEDLDELD